MKEKKPVSELKSFRAEVADIRNELKAMRGVLEHVKELINRMAPEPEPSCKTRGAK